MTRLKFLFLAAGLLTLVALGGMAPGRQPLLPAAPAPRQLVDSEEKDTKDTKDTKTKKTPAGRVLTSDSLAEMLDGMGYDFRTEALPNGGAFYWITQKSDTWTFVVGLSLAPNGSLIWFEAPLRDIPAAGACPPEQLVRLFQENWVIYPHSFAIPKDSRRLYLQRSLENQNITPAKLRGAIDAMIGTIRTTAPLWDVSKWGQSPATEPKKGPDVAAAYPDTPEGLTKFTKEVLALAKAGKRAEVAGKVKGLIVPGYEAWFKRVFGPEVGAALSEEYATGLTQLEANLTRQFMTAAEEGQSEVKVFKFTKADQEGVTASQAKILGAMAVKVPLYSVYLTQPGEESGMHLYSFVYADGGFRMAGKMRALTARTAGFRGLNGIEAAPPAERTDILGLARAEADRAAKQDEDRDVTGFWVHHGGMGPGAPRMTMRLNRNGTYTIVSPKSTDTGRYTIVAGVIFARSNSGLRSRVYVSWMGPDLASFGFQPDDDSATPTWLTFARMKGLTGAPANGARNEVNPLAPAFSAPIIGELAPGFFTPMAPAVPVAPNKLDPNDFRHLTPAAPSQTSALPGWDRRPDSAACPNRNCTGGWCYKSPGHGGPHQCGTCGWTWY